MTDPFEHLYKKEEVESWGKLQCYLRLSLPESQPSTCVSGGCKLGPGLPIRRRVYWDGREGSRSPNRFVTLQGGDPWATTYGLAQDWGR